ncbi:MAG: replication initiator protein A [Pirellulales bacterium]
MDSSSESNLAKVIQLEDFDRSLGTDELNLAEFPLAVLTTRNEPGKNTLLFEDTIFDEGMQKQINRSLVIAGSDHFGLPTSTDSDILLLLVHLTNVRSGFKSKRVEFSRYELIKFLGWSDDGRSYARLDKSLKRWTSVTLHYKHAWWQRSGQKWRSRSFHIIETLELRAKDERDDGLSTFTWNDTIFESFTAGNLRRIDLGVYFDLESATSRQMYRFLDKRFYRAHRLSFDLKTFALEHIGLSREYDVYDIKRKLGVAIHELESIGFLRPMQPDERFKKLRAGEWEVYFEKGCPIVPEDSSKERLAQELKNRGVNARSANQMVHRFSVSHIEEKVKMHDVLLSKRDPRISKNAAGFLASAIRNDYKAQAVQKIATKRIDRVQNAKADTTSNDLIASTSFKAFWEGLPIEEQAKLERDALKDSPRFHRDTLERLHASNSPLTGQMRLKLIEDFARKNGNVPSSASKPHI